MIRERGTGRGEMAPPALRVVHGLAR
jgi:hypothetical protein